MKPERKPLPQLEGGLFLTDGGIETRDKPVLISGCTGPRGDGYEPGERLTAEESADYHWPQVEALAGAGADQVSAMTMTHSEEAVGFCRAAERAGVPLVLSFTVETDGRLPSGETLAQAVTHVDEESGGYPSYYMVNCAHPIHIEKALAPSGRWLERLGGLKPNASPKSHQELNESTEVDRGDPGDLAARCGDLRRRLPRLNVFGGCCGTDLEHFKHLAEELQR